MTKTFTIAVPDEPYINKFELGRTQKFVVDVPSTLYVYVSEDSIIEVSKTKLPHLSEYICLSLSASTTNSIEQGLFVRYAQERESTNAIMKTGINYDGSTFEYKETLGLSDYYTIDCVNGVLVTKVKTRDVELPAEKQAKLLLQQVEVLLLKEAIENNLSDVLAFKAELEAYLSIVASAYPWNFIEFPDDCPTPNTAVKELLK